MRKYMDKEVGGEEKGAPTPHGGIKASAGHFDYLYQF